MSEEGDLEISNFNIEQDNGVYYCEASHEKRANFKRWK